MKFLHKYTLAEELQSAPPIVVREARGANNKKYIVKIFCKVGFTDEEIQSLLIELNFWLINPHPALTPIHEIVQEDPFIYIVYDYPLGGYLETLIFTGSTIFSEGFAKLIATNVLEGLAFLHLKGVIHGACLPSRIFFQLDQQSNGWAQSAQLSTIHVNYQPNNASFNDLKDLAYTLCAIVRRGQGIFSRQDYNPIILKTPQWSFVTPEFVDFINQLWNADKNAKGAEYFTEHKWLHAGKKVIARRDVKSYGAWCLCKINTKRSPFTRRKWISAYGRVNASVVLVSADEFGMVGPGDFAYPFALNLKSTELVIGVSRYNYTFVLQEKQTREAVIWMRFNNGDDFDTFKLAINEYTDPAIDESFMNPEVDTRYRDSLSKSVEARDYLQRRGSLLARAEGAENDEASEHGNAHPLDSLRWDQNRRTVEAVDAASNRIMYSLQCLGIAYRRTTQIRCGWSYGKGGSLAPYPSDKRAAIHPGKKWDTRVQELIRIIETGKPLNSPIRWDEVWFVIDATWFRHWKTFISSKRRMVPPGPIDNLWMVSATTSCLIEGLIEDLDDREGDYRCVTPEVWAIFEELYGGGPPISFEGPAAAKDIDRWTVHFAGLAPQDASQDDDFVEEFSDHESDVNSEEGVLHIDLAEGQKASLEELMKIAELFGFDDYIQDLDENNDIRLVNVEEGMGELFDMIDNAEQFVEDLQKKQEIIKRRASTVKKAKAKEDTPRDEETEEQRRAAMRHMIYRDFNDEESDSEDSVGSWSDEIQALFRAAEYEAANMTAL